MEWKEEGVEERQYALIPRTLIFVRYGREALLLRGHSRKARWAGKLNGLGGHVEPGEDILAAAQREVWEEAGLCLKELDLRALVHISPPEWHHVETLPWEQMVEDLLQLLSKVLEEQGLFYGLYASDEQGRLRLSFR
ncbi:MAG: NUDIX domain-containing protein [Anaerolineae bacterium]|nr:NUDIX domain-containing protein [Anaerolineae bacterium]